MDVDVLFRGGKRVIRLDGSAVDCIVRVISKGCPIRQCFKQGVQGCQKAKGPLCFGEKCGARRSDDMRGMSFSSFPFRCPIKKRKSFHVPTFTVARRSKVAFYGPIFGD